MQKIFSVPLNPKLNEQQYNQFLRFLTTYKDWIRDVYFTSRIAPFRQDAMGDVFVIEQYHQDAIDAALNIQRTLDIPVSATFNNIQVAPSQKNLDLFIKNFKPLYDAGIHSATIPHTHWMATGQIKAAFPKLYVKNTILRETHTAQEVVNLASYGFDYVNLDRDLMRDHDKLKEILRAKQHIKETFNRDISISLLANEGCAGGCSMMEEHFHFNNVREGAKPQYFHDVVSRVSCPKWEVTDNAISLKTADFPPWREDWLELLELGIDCIKMHGRESIERLEQTMNIISKFANNEPILYDTFDQYLQDNHLEDKPINVWRKKIKTCRFECWDCNYCDKVVAARSEPRFSELVNHVVDAVARSGVPTVRLPIPGLTSVRVQTLLNNLAQGVSTYMEVGTAMGATFCAVLKDNPLTATAIDNWKQDIQPMTMTTQALPANRIDTFMRNVNMYKGASTVNIIDSDALTLNVVPWLNSVQMWFYDGPHDRETTRQAVEHYWDTFTQEAILVFDDANWQPVVDGAREGIKSMSGHIGYEKLMLNDTEDAAAWWNGLYIAVIYK